MPNEDASYRLKTAWEVWCRQEWLAKCGWKAAGENAHRRPTTKARTRSRTGRRISPDDVPNYEGIDLFDQDVLRTIFIDFEDDDWESDLAAFYHTDIELPATLTVDGKTYSNVGIQFRGNSSFFSVSKGQKRSLSIAFDHVEKRDLEGYRGLTLLNANGDPTFLRSVLYMSMARSYRWNQWGILGCLHQPTAFQQRLPPRWIQNDERDSFQIIEPISKRRNGIFRGRSWWIPKMVWNQK